MGICKVCGGKGQTEKVMMCPVCNGAGYVPGTVDTGARIPCPKCMGRGQQVLITPCMNCFGTGRTDDDLI